MNLIKLTPLLAFAVAQTTAPTAIPCKKKSDCKGKMAGKDGECVTTRGPTKKTGDYNWAAENVGAEGGVCVQFGNVCSPLPGDPGLSKPEALTACNIGQYCTTTHSCENLPGKDADCINVQGAKQGEDAPLCASGLTCTETGNPLQDITPSTCNKATCGKCRIGDQTCAKDKDCGKNEKCGTAQEVGHLQPAIAGDQNYNWMVDYNKPGYCFAKFAKEGQPCSRQKNDPHNGATKRYKDMDVCGPNLYCKVTSNAQGVCTALPKKAETCVAPYANAQHKQDPVPFCTSGYKCSVPRCNSETDCGKCEKSGERSHLLTAGLLVSAVVMSML